MKENETPLMSIPPETRVTMLSAINTRFRGVERDFAMLDVVLAASDEPEFHDLTKEIRAKAAEWADRAQKLIIDQQTPATERR